MVDSRKPHWHAFGGSSQEMQLLCMFYSFSESAKSTFFFKSICQNFSKNLHSADLGVKTVWKTSKQSKTVPQTLYTFERLQDNREVGLNCPKSTDQTMKSKRKGTAMLPLQFTAFPQDDPTLLETEGVVCSSRRAATPSPASFEDDVNATHTNPVPPQNSLSHPLSQ